MNRKPNHKLLILFLHIIFANTMLAQINTNLPVGAIPGTIDVSPMGAATYTIPIEVVPGTQGMQPNLSIVYNSMGGIGLLGQKWSLSGLSAIRRSDKTLYHDDDLLPFSMGYNDKFSLDAEKLIQTSEGTYGWNGVEHATEIEDFSKVVSVGTYNAPYYYYSHFLAYKDDGTVVEYGNSIDSKQNLGQNPYSDSYAWYINKITDADGNYMTYHYSNSAEKLIQEIRYTGNANCGMGTYAKVLFSYISNTLDPNSCFVYRKYHIPQTKLLKTITITSQDSVVRQYTFNYDPQSATERTTHLREIIISDRNNKKIGSTTIVWGKSNNNPTNNVITLSNLPKGKTVVGDFNGDGYQDIVVYGIGTIYTFPFPHILNNSWELYTNIPGTENFLKSNSNGKHLTLYNYCKPDGLICVSTCDFHSADIDGDGFDELIIVEKKGYNGTDFKFAAVCSLLSLKNGVTTLDVISIKNFTQLLLGDFDGSGSTDIMFMKDTLKNTISFYSASTTYKDKMLPGRSYSFANTCPVVACNYKGDSRTFIFLNVGELEVHPYLGENVMIDHYSHSWKKFMTYASNTFSVFQYLTPHVYPGDFNGDGTTDFLTLDTAKNWKLYTGNFEYYTLLNTLNSTLINPDSIFSSPKYPPIVADINGDGIADIIQITPKSLNKTTAKILYFKGWANNSFNFEIKTIDFDGDFVSKDYTLIDLYNDGIIDILVYDNVAKKHNAICLYRNNQFGFVKSIIDGLGKEIHLSYDFKYLQTEYVNSTKSFYKKNFYPLVNSLRISNGLEKGTNVYQYQFQNLVFSTTKRTLLGFKSYNVKNLAENNTDYYTFATDAAKHILKPTSMKTYFGTTLTNETTYNIAFKNLPYKRFAPYSSLTLCTDYLNNTKSRMSTELNSEGRVLSSTNCIYNSYDANINSTANREIFTYNIFAYETFLLNGKQKKTILSTIYTMQDFISGTTPCYDTTIYSYYYDTPNLGRLKSVQQSNKDGTIKTTLSDYTPTGLYQQKDIFTFGSSPRTETYEYNSHHQFVTKITNPVGHIKRFSYNLSGKLLWEMDVNELLTSYTYDGFGNLTQTIYPDKTTTKTSIEWNCEQEIPNAVYFTHTTSTAKPDLLIYYDMLGRELCRYEDNAYYHTRYNAKGQMESTSYPFETIFTGTENKEWIKYTYDNYGRKETEKGPYSDLTFFYNARMITVTDNLRETTTTKNYDALGRITQAQDEGGTINYNYSITNSQKHKTEIIANGATTTILTDLSGNRISIDEPNAGTLTSTYNKFNELLSQKDARNNTTTYLYDKLGRVVEKKISGQGENQTVIYTYDNASVANKGTGKLYQIKLNKEVQETYKYDKMGRLYSQSKKIDSSFHTIHYRYDANGQLQKLTYPTGFTVVYNYDSQGKLKDIRRNKGDSLIYEVRSRNHFNQPTKCIYGNNNRIPIVTQYNYNDFGMVTGIKTTSGVQSTGGGTGGTFDDRGNGVVMNYVYGYNEKGLMTSRTDNTVNQNESYVYDNLDRLTKNIYFDYNGKKVTQKFAYENNGNIAKNSQVGNYFYDRNKPHAVTQIADPNAELISENLCEVTYNFFNQPSTITEIYASDAEHIRSIELAYGLDQQRNKTIFKIDDTVVSNRYYVNKYYEREVFDSISKHYNYIYGDNGVVALHIVTTGNGIISESDTVTNYFEQGTEDRDFDFTIDNTDGTYYIHTDHLGSYCAITNQKGNVVQRNCFDPWGNYAFEKRYLAHESDSLSLDEPSVGSTIDIISFPLLSLSFPITTRGFTGHEHYSDLKIINMNGRLYDPVISRFFSPDNYVQIPEFTQSYNRYSYCLNNPLKYTDPTGQRAVLDTWNYFLETGTLEKVDNNGGTQFQTINIMTGSSGENPGSVADQFVVLGNGYYIDCWPNEYGYDYSVSGNSVHLGDGMYHTSSFSGSYRTPFVTLIALSPVTVTTSVPANTPAYANSYRPEPMGGRIEYSPFNVGGLIGVGIAVKALVSAGAEMLGAAIYRSGTNVLTKGGGRAFFSGAGTEAKALGQGYTTIGQTRAGQNLMTLTKDMPYYPGSDAYKMWGRLSTQWAKGASGEVHVFQNAATGVDLRSIWRVYEYPALRANPNVTNIIFHY